MWSSLAAAEEEEVCGMNGETPEPVVTERTSQQDGMVEERKALGLVYVPRSRNWENFSIVVGVVAWSNAMQAGRELSG